MLQAELLGRRSIYIASTIILAQFTVSGYLETGRPTASKKVPGVDKKSGSAYRRAPVMSVGGLVTRATGSGAGRVPEQALGKKIDRDVDTWV